MARPTTTVGVQPNTKLLRIERIASDIHNWPHLSESGWMVWLNANRDFTCGTYLLLHDDGSIERVTAEPDGGEDIMIVKRRDNYDDEP